MSFSRLDASWSIARKEGSCRSALLFLSLVSLSLQSHPAQFDTLHSLLLLLLQCLWECGGNLAAPAIASGVIDKVVAFIAPKIIGGMNAPTPVGELGFVQMTQAIDLSSISFSTVGADSAKVVIKACRALY